MGPISLGVGDGGAFAPLPPLEINSGKFKIIRALNFGEDLFLFYFFKDHPNPMRKRGKI